LPRDARIRRRIASRGRGLLSGHRCRIGRWAEASLGSSPAEPRLGQAARPQAVAVAADFGPALHPGPAVRALGGLGSEQGRSGDDHENHESDEVGSHSVASWEGASARGGRGGERCRCLETGYPHPRISGRAVLCGRLLDSDGAGLWASACLELSSPAVALSWVRGMGPLRLSQRAGYAGFVRGSPVPGRERGSCASVMARRRPRS